MLSSYWRQILRAAASNSALQQGSRRCSLCPVLGLASISVARLRLAFSTTTSGQCGWQASHGRARRMLWVAQSPLSPSGSRRERAHSTVPGFWLTTHSAARVPVRACGHCGWAGRTSRRRWRRAGPVPEGGVASRHTRAKQKSPCTSSRTAPSSCQVRSAIVPTWWRRAERASNSSRQSRICRRSTCGSDATAAPPSPTGVHCRRAHRGGGRECHSWQAAATTSVNNARSRIATLSQTLRRFWRLPRLYLR